MVDSDQHTILDNERAAFQTLKVLDFTLSLGDLAGHIFLGEKYGVIRDWRRRVEYELDVRVPKAALAHSRLCVTGQDDVMHHCDRPPYFGPMLSLSKGQFRQRVSGISLAFP
jgi:hypothetical protein